MSDLIPAQSFDLSPKSLDEALKFADYLADSSIVPKDFIGKPGNILVAIQWGMELGLKPMQAMQNIAVINGRPSLWGDAVLALVRASPLCEYVYESFENGTATCRVKRRGEEEQMRTFSEADAKQAGLIGKQGPWAQYPNRMKQMRARAFALRDVFPDVLKGMPIAEEVGDYMPEKDITPREKQTPTQIAQNAAQSARPERTERHAKIIKQLEEVAKQFGFDPFKEEWSKLPREDRAAIGLEERNRIGNLANATPVEPMQTSREPGADDE
ncbi:recombinase RecT [Caballeronia sp. NCTM5]|uniref:recombinase RecT n=1 Tax=Caballeronia sp. NCTM5 TaxID=2921755 RepID=UPI0020287806|nr:recombinase RecT [Caballeronia sp. NCTM5]